MVRPHPQDANGFLLGENLIHHAVLNIDAARIRPQKISDRLLKRRRVLKWVGGQDRG